MEEHAATRSTLGCQTAVGRQGFEGPKGIWQGLSNGASRWPLAWSQGAWPGVGRAPAGGERWLSEEDRGQKPSRRLLVPLGLLLALAVSLAPAQAASAAVSQDVQDN